MVPSARRASGEVKTSSVGMFGTWRRPWTVSISAAVQRAAGDSPTRRSVPGPRKRTASKLRSFRSAARSSRLSTCCLHAATGSGSSRRTARATSSHSRSTSGSPKILAAQPSLG